MEFMFGMCHPDGNLDLVKEAGVNCIRYDIKFPFKKDSKEFTEQFKGVEYKVNLFIEKGFKVYGITPFPGFETSLEQGSKEYYEYYEEVCEFLGKYFEGRIEYWQVCNEIDAPPFREGLSIDQMLEFVKCGARGLKKGNPNAKAGVNPTNMNELTQSLLRRLYNDDVNLFDFAGIDGYPGSWVEGGPETWREWLDKLYEITKKPMIVAEFGYSSYGEVLTEEDLANEENKKIMKKKFPKLVKQLEDTSLSEDYDVAVDRILAMHFYRKWGSVWKKEHSPKEQAEFLTETYEMFRDNPNVIGAFWFCWRDATHCFWCDQEGCPCEIAWGVVDKNGKPKDAYYAYKKVSK